MRRQSREAAAQVRLVSVPATSHPARIWIGLAVMVAMMIVLGACGKSQDAATNLTPIAPNVPAQDLAKVPIGLEEATLTINGGTFIEGGLSLQVNQPTILRVVNRDDQSYQLQIVPNLVDPTPIPAATTTGVDLTDPNAGTYQAQLLTSDGSHVVATLPVTIENPAGNP